MQKKHAAWTLCALAVACSTPGLAGCDQPSPRALTKFDAQVVGGILTHDIVLTNRNLRSLKRIDLTVTVYFETEVKTHTRHWAYWKHDELQTVNVASRGRIQRVTMAGTAVAGAEEESVQLSADWLMKYQ